MSQSASAPWAARIVMRESAAWGYQVDLLVSFQLDDGEEALIDPASGKVGVH